MIPALLEKFPNAVVYCSPKCAENLKNMLGVADDKMHIVADGEELSLGGRTLKFILTPWVHWPDTMFTHVVEDNIIFTCDFFGAHYTANELWADCSPELALSAKRYYAEIMMPFAKFCVKYLAKVKELAPKMILPSHGPIYDENGVSFIENLYADWTSDSVAKKVILGYVSMYDNTTLMVNYLENALASRGVEVVKADLMETDEGELAMELIDSAGIVFGTSMVLTGPHPKSIYTAYLANILRPKLKFSAIIGSFGWGGNLTAPIDAMFTLTKPKKLENVIAKGRPKPEDFQKLDALADAILAEF
jgi:flavorubredoxin